MPDPNIKTAAVTIVLYDTPEQQMTAANDLLLTVRNANGLNRSTWCKGPVINLNLQFFDGPGDDYTITVYMKGYRGTGDFVHADPKVHQTASLLMIPSDLALKFAPWASLTAKFPNAARFFGLADDNVAAEQRYSDLQKTKPQALACFLNLIAAMGDIRLGKETPLSYIKDICWDNSFAQDRFFAYADPGIIPAIKAEAASGHFAEEPNPGAFHPGATLSYKQTDYDYSNVQLTFHGEDTKVIDGVSCVKIEPDMDLYKNLLDHGLLEVLPNLTTHGLTNPVDILSLRWLDADEDHEGAFDPGYVVA